VLLFLPNVSFLSYIYYLPSLPVSNSLYLSPLNP
jgi:hypothetical protein